MAPEFEINILLLVEDSDDDIIITQMKLFRTPLKIKEFLVAKTLTEAVNIVKQKNIDIALLDLNLPESKGLDTVVRFRKEYKGIIIVCTSLEDEMIGVEAIRQGADDYLVKSQMTEAAIARSVLYSRERYKAKERVKSIKQKLELLDQITGV